MREIDGKAAVKLPPLRRERALYHPELHLHPILAEIKTQQVAPFCPITQRYRAEKQEVAHEGVYEGRGG